MDVKSCNFCDLKGFTGSMEFYSLISSDEFHAQNGHRLGQNWGKSVRVIRARSKLQLFQFLVYSSVPPPLSQHGRSVSAVRPIPPRSIHSTSDDPSHVRGTQAQWCGESLRDQERPESPLESRDERLREAQRLTWCESRCHRP
jgi:hypothetical protein